MNMDLPKPTVIKVIGLGGGGSNAVNRMMDMDLEGVEYVAANTDAQALRQSRAPVRLQLGPELTKGLGAGGKPDRGQAAAEESREAIQGALRGADMVFLTAGMGGGTGTGAIPVVAEISQSLGILTVAVVTTPFTFEAAQRQRNADNGLAKLRPHVDTLITVPNDKLLAFLPRNTTLELALRVADEVLRQGVQGIIELVSKPGLMNVDFANVRNLMRQAGTALMAIGQGRGENKAVDAVHQALRMPLLDVKSMDHCRGLLLHFTGGEDLSLFEVNAAVSELGRMAPNGDVVMGASIDPMWNGRTQVILIVSGVDNQQPAAVAAPRAQVVVQPARPAPKPASVPAAEAAGHLAEQLFSHAITEATPLQHTHVEPDSYPADVNNLDLPAFLRKRTLRGLEGSA
jgi:cell division protein FtsZ